MSDTPLVPGPLYGLRTWSVVRDGDGERLAAPLRGTPWPAGTWVEATCARTPRHAAPGPACDCGIHAWHPSRRNARRILASRRDIPGIVEADGAIELHEHGFRAERGRPHALVLTPGRNVNLIERLAEAYGTPVVEVRGPDELVAWCRERGLGLEAPVVAELLGPEWAQEQHEARRRKARSNALRVAAAVAATAVLLLVATQVLPDPQGPRTLHGRTGEIHVK